ncbi:uncharacterized protein ISCGN_028812 [Ixodes scapularis]
MRPGLRRSDVDVSPPNVSTVMCDASEPFYFLRETLFRQQVTRCLREASKCSYSPLRRAERAAELSKADLPQRWHPENRPMALAKVSYVVSVHFASFTNSSVARERSIAK